MRFFQKHSTKFLVPSNVQKRQLLFALFMHILGRTFEWFQDRLPLSTREKRDFSGPKTIQVSGIYKLQLRYEYIRLSILRTENESSRAELENQKFQTSSIRFLLNLCDTISVRSSMRCAFLDGFMNSREELFVSINKN